MKTDRRFSFIVDQDIAGRMDRVILMGGGRVMKKELGPERMVFRVEKT